MLGIIKLRRRNGRACSSYGAEKMYVDVLVGKPERKRPHGICRSRWKNNIKMAVKEIGWDDCN
jgi:hypothetical protein